MSEDIRRFVVPSRARSIEQEQASAGHTATANVSPMRESKAVLSQLLVSVRAALHTAIKIKGSIVVAHFARVHIASRVGLYDPHQGRKVKRHESTSKHDRAKSLSQRKQTRTAERNARQCVCENNHLHSARKARLCHEGDRVRVVVRRHEHAQHARLELDESGLEHGRQLVP